MSDQHHHQAVVMQGILDLPEAFDLSPNDRVTVPVTFRVKGVAEDAVDSDEGVVTFVRQTTILEVVAIDVENELSGFEAGASPVAGDIQVP